MRHPLIGTKVSGCSPVWHNYDVCPHVCWSLLTWPRVNTCCWLSLRRRHTRCSAACFSAGVGGVSTTSSTTNHQERGEQANDYWWWWPDCGSVEMVVMATRTRCWAGWTWIDPGLTAVVAENVTTCQLQGSLQYIRAGQARQVSGHCCCLVV